MPSDGISLRPSRELLSFAEIERVVGVLAGFGIKRIRLTGGEPLVRRDLVGLVERLVRIDGVEKVLMTTNAHLLADHAQALRDAGLAGLTVSVDSLDPERFSEITRGGDVARVFAGIEAALLAGFDEVKINTVVIRGFNDDELIALTQWAMEMGVTPRFIEFMPIGSETIWGRNGTACVSAKEMVAVLKIRYQMRALGMASSAGPARYYHIDGPGAGEGGRLGIISAVTDCFCDDCNRIRLTPQGGIRACLADDREVGIREAMRAGIDDDGLMGLVRASLGAKLPAHSFDINGGVTTSKQMVSIGG
jgi:cyclic pyranopterin phosphate synthase